MCLHPITIPNTFWDGHSSGKSKYRSRMLNKDDPRRFKNRKDSRIQVPCGHCKQCVSNRQGFVTQRVQMESLRSHLFFFTLTYNNRLRFTDVLDYHLPYPHYEHVQHMFDRLRKRGYVFRYWVVSEYGKKGRPHYHGILAIPKDDTPISTVEQTWYSRLLNEWAENVGSKKKPDYKPLLDYVRRRVFGKLKCTYDFKYIEPIRDHDNDVSFYVSKYILKYDKRIEKLLKKISLDARLEPEQRVLLISQIKPRSIMSKDYGDWKLPEVKAHILNNLGWYDDIPQYCDLYTGKLMMLSRYYMRLVPLSFYENRQKFSIYEDSYNILDDSSWLEGRMSSDSRLDMVQSFKEIQDFCWNSKDIDLPSGIDDL